MGLAAGAAIGAVGTLGSAIVGSSAASDAANAQVQAANTAAQTQLSMYNQTRSDLSGYNTVGQSAISQLASLFGVGGSGSTTPNTAAMTTALENTPGYQFGLSQGTQALDRSAASRGLTLSGAQLKDAQAYGTGYAQQTAWAPYISELGNLASLGENAASQTGNAGTAAASGAASSQLAAGQASAAGTVSSANILGSAINSGTSQLGNLISSYGNNATKNSLSPEMAVNTSSDASSDQFNAAFGYTP